MSFLGSFFFCLFVGGAIECGLAVLFSDDEGRLGVVDSCLRGLFVLGLLLLFSYIFGYEGSLCASSWP